MKLTLLFTYAVSDIKRGRACSTCSASFDIRNYSPIDKQIKYFHIQFIQMSRFVLITIIKPACESNPLPPGY